LKRGQNNKTIIDLANSDGTLDARSPPTTEIGTYASLESFLDNASETTSDSELNNILDGDGPEHTPGDENPYGLDHGLGRIEMSTGRDQVVE